MARQDRSKNRMKQMKKEGKGVHEKNANLAKSMEEKAFNKLMKI
jgi:hypothetical protein